MTGRPVRCIIACMPSRRTAPALTAPSDPVEVVVDEDGDEFVLDFGFPQIDTLTAEQSREHAESRARRGLAAAHAYRCAQVDGRDADLAARTAAARTT